MSTAVAEQTSHSNKVQIADAGPSLKKISIEIPASVVEDKLKTSMAVLSDQAALPGFRKGKVPKWLVEKKFGKSMRDQAKSELAGDAYRKAVEDHKLKVVADPSGGNLDKVDVVDGKPLSFELEVEVLPEFELPSLEGIEIRKPTLEVTDAIIDDEIKKICINEGNLESRDNAEPGDYLTGHAIMKGKDGTEFYNLKGAVVQKPASDKNGKGMILGIMVDDFDKQLGKPKAGDTFTIKAKGPEQHEVEGIRNNDLTMTFQVERIDRIIPANVDDIVKNFGMQDEKQLRDAIRQRLGVQVQIQAQTAMHNQIAKHLIDKTKLDLPTRITAVQAERTLQRQRMELLYRGVEAHKIEEHMAELRAQSGASAVRDLKMFFILFRASEQLNVQVRENEVNQRIVQMAMQRNMRPEQLVQQLRQSNQVNAVVQQIRDHKTLDAIVAKAKVTEMSADEYNKWAKDQK